MQQHEHEHDLEDITTIRVSKKTRTRLNKTKRELRLISHDAVIEYLLMLYEQQKTSDKK